MAARKYEKRSRAVAEEETRRRITEAAVALHGALGPARTTISAIAEHAGVQRLTVYRHFPDEAAILRACSQHWLAQHPWPNPTLWDGEPAGRPRLEVALRAFYAYYGEASGMLTNVLRDAPLVPALKASAEGYDALVGAARDGLAQGWRVRGKRRELVRAAIGHALHLESWRSLTRGQGLDDGRAVGLMVALVEGAVGR